MPFLAVSFRSKTFLTCLQRAKLMLFTNRENDLRQKSQF